MKLNKNYLRFCRWFKRKHGLHKDWYYSCPDDKSMCRQAWYEGQTILEQKIGRQDKLIHDIRSVCFSKSRKPEVILESIPALIDMYEALKESHKTIK